MSTTNFSYKNRCVVVTDEDYNDYNMPTLGEWVNNNNYYPSRILSDYDNFNFQQIVITSGYYQDACIDFYEKDTCIEDFLGSTGYYPCKIDFIKECKSTFNLSKYMINKLCGTLKDFGNDMDAWIENAYIKVEEYLKEKESDECNKIIDQIKKDYCYEEYALTGVFSNGEGVYHKVS